MTDRRDETPYVIVEKRSSSLGAFLGRPPPVRSRWEDVSRLQRALGLRCLRAQRRFMGSGENPPGEAAIYRLTAGASSCPTTNSEKKGGGVGQRLQ